MTGPIKTKRMKIRKEVAIRADLFREKTKELGEAAANAFSDKHRAQLSGLENIANSALKISDVLDYIKRQTGKSKPGKGWKAGEFGKRSLEFIEGKLRKERDNVCKKLNIIADAGKLEVYLMLIREFVKQIVIHYEFTVGEMQK